MQYGIVQHELLHALGQVHEHTRPDRDDHVEINEENIEPGKQNNFRKKVKGKGKDEVAFMDSTYDMYSLLHYPGTAWSKDDKSDTITPINKKYRDIGGTDGMTATDIIELNLHYECPDISSMVVIDYIHDVENRLQMEDKNMKEKLENIEVKLAEQMEKQLNEKIEEKKKGCSKNAILVSRAPPVSGFESSSMVLCDDPTDSVCERDLETICPAGFHLCTPTEFNTLNDNWDVKINSKVRPVGEINCRGKGTSAGHFSLTTTAGSLISLAVDKAKNNMYGSSRPECPEYYGTVDCNKKQFSALCCSALATCGDGVVQAPLEECDDGNKDNYDLCLNTCSLMLTYLYL